MAWNIGENKYAQFVTVWEVEDKGTWASVKLGTSRKDKKTGEYANSNWSFVRFVGNAYNDDLLALEPKTRIIIKSGMISQEPYMKDGEKVWPKNPGIVVFAWEMPDEDNRPAGNTKKDKIEDEEDNGLPF